MSSMSSEKPYTHIPVAVIRADYIRAHELYIAKMEQRIGEAELRADEAFRRGDQYMLQRAVILLSTFKVSSLKETHEKS